MHFVISIFFFFCIKKNKWWLHTTYPKREVPQKVPESLFWGTRLLQKRSRHLETPGFFFFTILIGWKCLILNFHLENSRTWIFNLWNNILRTQISLLQPICVYTYIYNRFMVSCSPRFFYVNFMSVSVQVFLLFMSFVSCDKKCSNV